MLPFRHLVEAVDAAPADRPFVTSWIDEDEQETVTFGEFRRRARLHAGVLRNSSVASGDRVVILMPQGIPAMTAFVGAMMIGAVPAFLAYPNFKVEAAKYRSGLAGVTANLSAKAVVIDDEFPDEMLGHVVLEDDTKLLRIGRDVEGKNDDQVDFADIQPESLAFIQHSAGTTGLQKGVALTHAAVLRQIGHLAQALKIDGATDRVYSWLPLYHDMGLIACFILPMLCHVPIVMQSPLDWVMHPETMLEIISEYKCTLAWMPNFAFQFVPRRTPGARRGKYDLSSLRALINCSEPVRASSMAEFQKTFNIDRGVLHSSYAMAENVFAVTQSGIDGHSGPACIWADGQQFRGAHRIVLVEEGAHGAVLLTSSGCVLPGQHCRIVAEDGATLSEGGVGEILIRGDCLFKGYFNRSDLTAQAMVDDPTSRKGSETLRLRSGQEWGAPDKWYRTGDLGFLLDRELFVIGRKKDLLIVGGENIYPQDIEEIVANHPAMHDGRAIAMGVFNPELGTEEIVVVAEVENEDLLAKAAQIEQEIRKSVVAGMGVAVKTIFLKPPKWIVKSTAGKAARSATREKLLREHPELNTEVQENA